MPSPNAVELLRCNVGDCRFALEMSAIEAVRSDDTFKPSAARSGPLGYVQHRGVETPVYALADLLERSHAAIHGSASILIMRGSPAWGLAVEQRSQTVSAPLERLFTVPRPLAASVGEKVRGIAALDDGIAYLLDAARLHAESSMTPPITPLRDVETAFRFPVRAAGHPQIFRFQLPGEDDGPVLLVSAGQTAAALNPAPLTPRYGADQRVLGLIAFQGIPTPVFDSGRLLGRAPTRYADSSKLLLVRGRRNGQLCALPVGSNPRLTQAPAASRPHAVPEGVSGLLGAFEVAGETLWALDVDAALEARE